MNTGISADLETKIIKIIEIIFPDAKIYLFGSRARGDFDDRSDIDIAIDNGKRTEAADRVKIINMIDALNTPQSVDIVDINIIDESMRQVILKEGIIWKN
jgi:predicted nucleotidyltransferase